MDSTLILSKLQQIAKRGDFFEEASELTDTWRLDPDAVDAIDPILRFMEQNPSFDFGSPGPLVHFVETFFRRGYEQKLTESINRKPTPHTVSMLNRMINVVKEPDEKRLLIELLRRVVSNPEADTNAKQRAIGYLSFQLGS